jgi:hypothetical protein
MERDGVGWGVQVRAVVLGNGDETNSLRQAGG